MSECSLVGWLTFGVLTATLIVIAWYTVETFKLRREAQLNTELQNRPFLSLQIAGPRGTKADIQIANIGKGPARSVSVAARSGETFEMKSQMITHIGAGLNAKPRWIVLARAAPEEPRTEIPSEDTWPMASNLLTNQPFMVDLTYASIVGQRYRTTVRVEEGLAEIVADDRISGKG
jgi:hypothetical protein